jgi:redox-sensitive bicupin YhaK (pirin superfamily)
MSGDTDALPIRADARVLGATVKAGETIRYDLGPSRRAYLVPASGQIRIQDVVATARDGVAIREEASIEITALEDTEIVLVDTP